MHSAVRKYAHAYLNLNEALLSYDVIKDIERFGQFLAAQKRFLFFLKVPLLNEEHKEKGLARVYEQYPVPDSLRALVSLLVQEQRMDLIGDVCVTIGVLYKEQHAIYEFQVMSSSALNDEQKKDIEHFLKKRVTGTVVCAYTVTEELIAGIRIQSATRAWEHSINQQLRAVQRMQRA